jgi:hypothetical protein
MSCMSSAEIANRVTDMNWPAICIGWADTINHWFIYFLFLFWKSWQDLCQAYI